MRHKSMVYTAQSSAPQMGGSQSKLRQHHGTASGSGACIRITEEFVTVQLCTHGDLWTDSSRTDSPGHPTRPQCKREQNPGTTAPGFLIPRVLTHTRSYSLDHDR